MKAANVQAYARPLMRSAIAMARDAIPGDGRFSLDHNAFRVRTARALIDAEPPSFVIGRDGCAYLERWHLLRKGTGTFENVYLHRFVRNDPEELHDHPWANCSIVLSGRYTELTGDGERMERTPGDIVGRYAEARHAIVDVEPGTLTLFVTKPKVRDWGFHTEDGWIRWDAFRTWKNAKAGREVISAAEIEAARRT